MNWLWAAVAVVAGCVIGALCSKLAKQMFERRKGRIAQLAPAASSLTFSLLVVVGLLVALGFVQPESVEKLRDDTIEYLPRALSALIVVILGGVVGTIAATAVREAVGRSLGAAGAKVPTIIKAMVTAFSAILAASQLGIDTTVINIVVAGCIFGVTLAFALLVGLGGQSVASEIARGRAIRRVIALGDEVTSDAASGTVVGLHATAIELESGGQLKLMPYSRLEAMVAVTRPDSTEVLEA